MRRSVARNCRSMRYSWHDSDCRGRTGMGEWKAGEQATSKANAAWQRLLDSFGDSLLRKFGDTPPQEWERELTRLTEYQIDRAFRRMNARGLTSPPTLPQFLRLARSVVEEDDPPQAAPYRALEHAELNRWEAAGTEHLVNYLRRQVAKDLAYFGPTPSVAALRSPGPLRCAPTLHRNVQRFVAARDAWVADMQDLDKANGERGVDPALQQATWSDYIQRAESALQPAQEGEREAPTDQISL